MKKPVETIKRMNDLDELVRELRECHNSAHIRWELFDEAAAALVALKAERDALKAHAEAMAATLDTWAEIDQCKCHALDAYRRDFPKDALGRGVDSETLDNSHAPSIMEWNTKKDAP